MSTPSWRARIEAAGGPERAMLYGRPLVDLLAHVAEVELDRDAARIQKAEAEAGAESARRDRSELCAILDAERAALVDARRTASETAATLVRALAVVRAAIKEREVGVPSGQLEDALAAWEER